MSKKKKSKKFKDNNGFTGTIIIKQDKVPLVRNKDYIVSKGGTIKFTAPPTKNNSITVVYSF